MTMLAKGSVCVAPSAYNQTTIAAVHCDEVEAVLAAAAGPTDDGASHLNRYEVALAFHLAAADAVAVSSDSGAVVVLLGALNVASGDGVLVCYDAPAWVLGALEQARVEVVQWQLAGVFGSQGAGELDALGRFKAVLYQPSDNDADNFATVRTLAAGIGAPLVLDLGRSFGGSASTASTVRHADVAFFATGEAQGPFSTGEGGVLLFHDAELAERARSFAQFGRLAGIRIGVNHKISPAQAALGRSRLEAVFGRSTKRHYSLPEPTSKTTLSKGTERTTKALVALRDRFDPRSPADRDEISRALADDLSGAGEPVRRYEQALGRWFGAPYALSVSSGYAAVLVALAALDLQPGDEVLLAPTCPLCTVFALTSLGVTPVFCDTEPDSFSLDLNQARKRLSPHTRVVMDVPMWGYPVRADKTAEFAKEHGLYYVLDLALGHGIELDGQLIWRHADIATFSTHGSKILVTGEGGIMLCTRADLAKRLRASRHYGNRDSGLNYRLAGVQAALGIARLPALSDHIRQRRQLMRDIETGLDNPHLSAFPQVPGGAACGVKMLVRERAGAGNALNDHLEVLGIPSDIRTYRCRPLYEFPVLAERSSDCPNAARLLSSIATLPVHPGIDAEMRDCMIAALNAYGGQPR